MGNRPKERKKITSSCRPQGLVPRPATLSLEPLGLEERRMCWHSEGNTIKTVRCRAIRNQQLLVRVYVTSRPDENALGICEAIHRSQILRFPILCFKGAVPALDAVIEE